MRRIIGTVVVAVAIGGVCWFFGLGVVSSLIVVTVIVATGVALGALPGPGPAMDWPHGPAAVRDGTRHETSQLSWSLRTGRRTVDDRIVARIRGIAVDRLALRQLDLDDPGHRRAIERLIGADVYALLSTERTRPAQQAAIAHALDILEGLGRRTPPHTAAGPERSTETVPER